MRVRLLHEDRDLDLQAGLPPQADDLIRDLELGMLVEAMAAGDPFLAEVARRVLLTGVADPAAIGYRQQVLADCLAHPQLVRDMYGIAVDALTTRRKVHSWLVRDRPEATLGWAVQMMQLLAGNLRQLRQLADRHADRFTSQGFTRLLAELADQLDDAYLATVDAHLEQLRLRRGVLLSAGLGPGNRRAKLRLHRLPPRGWRERLPGRTRGWSFQIPDRDEAGHQALAELRNHSLTDVAEALAGAVEHVLGYFTVLRAELGFYLGCLNLHQQLTRIGLPTCLPEPLPTDPPTREASGLYEPCLALHLNAPVVGNDLAAEHKTLVMVTGANQGGKSTFLRAAGVAQLMMQAGMFVPAESYRASVHTGVFTHFKREEDPTMTRGKLDEELARMSQLVDRLTPGGLLLCNESFASTNEQEGSEIARQLVDALTGTGVTVYYVTHLYELADNLHRRYTDTALFLRAQRQPDGTRTFRIVPGPPEPTSHGEDSYRRILATAEQPEPLAPAAVD
jgi:hypothetical protein